MHFLSRLTGAHLTDDRIKALLEFLASDVDLEARDEERIRASFSPRLRGEYLVAARTLHRQFFLRALQEEQARRVVEHRPSK